MLEFIVPEPAAFYLHLQSNQTLRGVSIEKPKEPMVSGRRLEPTDLSNWNYTYFVAQYNVQDVDPYPEEVVRVSAAFAEASGTAENVDYAERRRRNLVYQRVTSVLTYLATLTITGGTAAARQVVPPA